MKKKSIYSFVKLFNRYCQTCYCFIQLIGGEIVNDIAATLGNTALASQTTSFSTSYNIQLTSSIFLSPQRKIVKILPIKYVEKIYFKKDSFLLD